MGNRGSASHNGETLSGHERRDKKSPTNNTKQTRSESSSIAEDYPENTSGEKEFESVAALAFETDYSQDFSLLESSSLESSSLNSSYSMSLEELDTYHADSSVRRDQAAREETFAKKTTTDPKPEASAESAANNNNDNNNSMMRFGVRRSDKAHSTCVFFLCVLGAVLVASFTYFYTSRLDDAVTSSTLSSSTSNQHIITKHSTVTLQHVSKAIQQQWDNLLEIFQGESEDITVLSSATGANWPFWTIKDWERRASHLDHLAPYLSLIGWAPLVEPQQVGSWERYSVYQGDSLHHDMLWDEIQGDFQDTMLAPIWHTFPPPTGNNQTLINYNLLYESSNTATFLQEWNTPPSRKDALMTHHHNDGDGGPSYDRSPLGVLSDWIPEDNFLLQQKEGRIRKGSGGPYSLLIQPVFDTDEVEIRTVRALLFGVFSWEAFLRHSTTGLLTSTGQDHNHQDPQLQAFLSNSCGERQFQHVDGTGGMQEIMVRPTTDDAPVIVVLNNNNNDHTQSSKCHYYVELRHNDDPSSTPTLLSSERSDDPTRLSPAGFTSLVAAVLLIMGCVVASYINSLHEHYDKVQKLATSASGVLLSMFPTTVCERILEEAAQREKNQKELQKRKEEEQKRLKMAKEAGFLNEDSIGSMGTSGSGRKTRGSKDSAGNPSNKNDLSSVMDGTFTSFGEVVDEDESDESLVYDKMIMESLQQNNRFKAKPIADLFPEATVLFSDIVGFTAWSSSRCPTHVFDLLETIYHTFDQIARRRRVFKVETIGDCYVAVTGIPTPRADHAVVMARFARDCLHAMDIVTANLEAILGPDTADLSMRFGLHSGPVTAGVLRGERSRFQLFGDTVNVASRMESNSKPGRIHISQDTANYLAADKKANWFLHREDKVHAKGKGELQTYWIDPSAIDAHNQMIREAHTAGAGLIHPTLQQASNIVEARRTSRDLNADLIPEKQQRLIDWQVDQLHQLLLRIMARRKQLKKAGHRPKNDGVIPQATVAQCEVTVFDEVKEVIEMPSIHPLEPPQVDCVKICDNVLWQLNDYVTSVSTLYRERNPFHNFEHASHVCLSVTKMLGRVVAGPQADKLRASLTGSDIMLTIEETDDPATEKTEDDKPEDKPEDYSYGISADPLTQFAVVFAALIHDVDHLGVSNAQLVKENDRLARIYKNQSVAEQNSVNLAWDLLMDPSFSDLRKCIYTTEEEYVRFRSMVINSVMATDIVDGDLKKLRNARWEKAFSKQGGEMTKEDKDRKTTIIVEHLLQASDIAHTMQHWQVYHKWNFLLFQEMYVAYKKGRMEKNPLDFWYNGELGFFDFYIIPLAKKLKECGVFGVSCDEYLNYAINNRAEWEERGKEIVQEYRTWAENRDRAEKNPTRDGAAA